MYTEREREREREIYIYIYNCLRAAQRCPELAGWTAITLSRPTEVSGGLAHVPRLLRGSHAVVIAPNTHGFCAAFALHHK